MDSSAGTGPDPLHAATTSPIHACSVADYLAEMEALARFEQPDVRWHRFGETAIVAGRATVGFVDAEAANARNIAVFERSSGGGPVLLTPYLLALAIAVPAGHPLWCADLTESYAWLGRALAGAAETLGIPARAIPVAEARAENPLIGRMACFAARSPHEVFAGESKLWGLAQHRTRTTALLVAGLYLAGDPAILADFLQGAPGDLAMVRRRLGAVATLTGLAPACSVVDVVAAVARELARAGVRAEWQAGRWRVTL
ncbi:MAG: hypothetical protein HY331_15695 [Chloroflexi bacterium]|nr:hypothetical protein [Chloroflexota bacterium]